MARQLHAFGPCRQLQACRACSSLQASSVSPPAVPWVAPSLCHMHGCRDRLQLQTAELEAAIKDVDTHKQLDLQRTQYEQVGEPAAWEHVACVCHVRTLALVAALSAESRLASQGKRCPAITDALNLCR